MKYLGNDATGAPKFSWCCDRARDLKDVIGFLDDGKRKYDSDRTGFFIHGICSGPNTTKRGVHQIYKIFFCPFCGQLVED